MKLYRRIPYSTIIRVATLWRKPRDQIENPYKQQEWPCGDEKCREKEKQKDEWLQHM